MPVPTQSGRIWCVYLVYKNVDGSPDPQTNTGRGLNATQYVVRRRLLFDGLKQGGPGPERRRRAHLSYAAQRVSRLGRVRPAAIGSRNCRNA